MPEQRRGGVHVVHHGIVLLIFASAVTASLVGVVTLRRVHAPLAEHLGGKFPWLAFALYASLVATTYRFVSRVRAWCRREWTTAGGVEFRAALCVLVVLLLYVVLYLQPARDVYLLFSLAVAAGVFVLLLALLQRNDGSPRSRLTRALDFVLFNACFLLIATEIALNIWATARPSHLLSRVDRGPAQFVRSFRQKPSAVRWGLKVNSKGYSDDEYRPKRQGEKQVIAIGDSFSTGVVPQSLHYTRVCERELPGVDVYNMGVPAIGPPEYLHLLRTEALSLEPDAIVIGLFIGNDICFADTRSEGRDLWRRWLAPQSYLAVVVPRRWRRIQFERRMNAGGLVGEVQGATQQPTRALETLDDFIEEFPWMGDPTLEKASFSKDKFQEIETFHAFNTCSNRRPECYERLFGVLADIRDDCRDIPLLFLLIPDEFQVDDDVWEMATTGADRIWGNVELDRSRPQRLIKEWLDREGLPYVDVLPKARAVEHMPHGRRHLYHLRDTHLNVRGNEVTGKALAEGLRALFAQED